MGQLLGPERERSRGDLPASVYGPEPFHRGAKKTLDLVLLGDVRGNGQ